MTWVKNQPDFLSSSLEVGWVKMGRSGCKPINTFYVHFVYTLDYYFFLANFPSTFDPLSRKYLLIFLSEVFFLI
ncbi:hypothetical protein HanPSC8_Chr09g0352301 [Helianthus annuus]|nr:hypothetical protein HanPSC8_Chr09g0352301 [Helianthus annuus]